MSQLIQRLDRDLAATTDRRHRAELFARKACALARVGRFDEARELIQGLRSNFGDWSNGQTHVWIMIAEGIVNWFVELNPIALDRLTRAQVLSVAMRYDAGIAISAAWKAHIEFEMSNFDSMIRSLRLALSANSELKNDVNARIAIVICNACSYCGEWTRAQDWFVRGLKYSLLEGDRAGIEALQYNRAALAITWIRCEKFDGRFDVSAIHIARRELESARNYSELTGISTLNNHLALCDARLTVLEGRYALATEMLRKVRGEVPFASYHFSNQLIDLEIAYCIFKAGDSVAARDVVRDIDVAGLIDLDVDDRFAAVSMLQEMSNADPAFGDSQSLLDSQRVLRVAYDNSMVELRDGILDLMSLASGE